MIPNARIPEKAPEREAEEKKAVILWENEKMLIVGY